VRKKLLTIAALAGVVVGGFLAWRWWTDDAAPLTYTTQPARIGDVVQAVTASGTLSPVIKVDVGSQVSGRIQELLVDYNDKVTAGQVIARIDPETTKAAVTQAKARLTSARADLARAQATAANARIEYQRALDLAKSGAISASEVDAAKLASQSAAAALTGSHSQIVEAQAALAQAETNLTYTTIKSPIDGIVISRAVNVGQTVAASLSAPTLFTIAGDLRQMEVHTSVAEADVGQLAEGMRVEFTVDAFPDDTFTGTVKQVRFEATTVQNVVTYDAVVNVPNEQMKLRPGMTANVTFVIAEARDVLTVPSKALRYRPPGVDPQAVGGRGRDGAGGGSGGWRGRDGDGSGAGSGGRGEGRRRRGGGGGGGGSGSGTGDDGGTGNGSGGGSGGGTGIADDAAGGGSGAGNGNGLGRRRQRPQAVWVLRDGTPERVRVETGLTDGTTTEITGGELKEGDLVISADSTARSTGGAGSGNRPNQPFGGTRRGSRGPF
jgi:HlyD family secretion protein